MCLRVALHSDHQLIITVLSVCGALIETDTDSTARTFINITAACCFELRTLHTSSAPAAAFAAAGFCWVIAELPEWQINPQQTEFFFLDHHLHHMLNDPAPPAWEMGSKSTEKKIEITKKNIYIYSFPFPSQRCHLQIKVAPLTLFMCSMFSAVVAAHACFWLVSIPPSSPAVPLNFPETLSRPPFQIGFWLNLPCLMSLCGWIPHLIWTHHKAAEWAKYYLSKLFFSIPPPPPALLVICHSPHLFLCEEDPPSPVAPSRWRVSIRGKVLQSHWCLDELVVCSGKWQDLLIWPFNLNSNSVRLHHLQSHPVIQSKPPAQPPQTHTHT